MKKRIAILGLLPLLLSCASFPEPEAPENSLVIGYLVLDYPDGYFEHGRRTFTSGITVNLTNQASGRKFWLTTSNGFFHFLSNGTDSYTLDTYKLSVEGATSEGRLKRSFTTKPHSVVYLGHLTLTYAHPQKKVSNLDTKLVYWDYEFSSSFKYNEGDLQTYLQSRDPDGPWQEYEVVH